MTDADPKTAGRQAYMATIAACPWCGGSVETDMNGPDSWFVACQAVFTCCASGPLRPTEAQAVEDWNRVASVKQ